MKKKGNKAQWKVGYVIGRYSNLKNKCDYLDEQYVRFRQFLPQATIYENSRTANEKVERNESKYGTKILSKDATRDYTLFVSKVFYTDDRRVSNGIKLTKNNSFQLMEVVINHI